jgi:hypothetical protein
MDAANQLPSARVVALTAFLLARLAPLASEVARQLPARHAQPGGFETRIPFAFASGVAFADVRGGHGRVLAVSGAVGFVMLNAQELPVVELRGLDTAEAVAEFHKATASGWGDG